MYLVNSQPLACLLHQEPPCKKNNPSSSITGTVQDNIENGVCKGFPFIFCMQVGFVGTDSEVSIEPEDTGSGEGWEEERSH
jgi:hypothetical protein